MADFGNKKEKVYFFNYFCHIFQKKYYLCVNPEKSALNIRISQFVRKI